jgi:hypothetical protein
MQELSTRVIGVGIVGCNYGRTVLLPAYTAAHGWIMTKGGMPARRRPATIKLRDALSRDDESSGEKNCIRLCNNCNVWDEPEMNDHFISSESAGASNLMPVG